MVLGGFAVAGPRIRVASAGGVLMLVFNVGGAVGSPVIGSVVDRASWSGVFAVLASALMVLLLLRFAREATAHVAGLVSEPMTRSSYETHPLVPEVESFRRFDRPAFSVEGASITLSAGPCTLNAADEALGGEWLRVRSEGLVP